MSFPTVPDPKNEVTDLVIGMEETVTLKADTITSSVETNLIPPDDSDSTATPSPESHASPLMEDVAVQVQLNVRAGMVNVATIQIIPKGKLTKATDTKAKNTKAKSTRATDTKATDTKTMDTKPSGNTLKPRGSSNQPKPPKPRPT